ncbi:uncharacterized protein MONOS_13892 [Monocercomonoides exilis]|uniref:uncharacterized protein n=1 Tax=Monocercomonoides exilis TaxID=2049356 RepID=UPI003559BF82|nr:hypothetical protein MONOS_13892 [Monocercomonoides exilis]|eukprot:MONOS_13892.1-p1 / transcript=MONOS_13892.1 / gene=MONOS_13892 / organism=Monocercomonoides_exilis_PA203 / gene_product=unspecified product / transcript_product=unspecified product / location=Mono_scaffold00900:10869-11204(+) / protein_length=112 / sequence_SO=supercontig / SO=protein_coding / is_pseudo=false
MDISFDDAKVCLSSSDVEDGADIALNDAILLNSQESPATNLPPLLMVASFLSSESDNALFPSMPMAGAMPAIEDSLKDYRKTIGMLKEGEEREIEVSETSVLMRYSGLNQF